jgi:hypothetical protein
MISSNGVKWTGEMTILPLQPSTTKLSFTCLSPNFQNHHAGARAISSSTQREQGAPLHSIGS